ncbi:hypothetical protein B0H14DRAFT_430402 [Mycena olivaceomarginata]|nr:hypothetical protein B0H14DRAFT_430402 [Mycena olivaceomarginata]
MASSSCTETTTYALQKYSRAYTSKKPTGSSEWQHFTNPVLRLILDSKLSPERANSSLRMRIVWTMEGNQDVILEDLDLLAFSSAQGQLFQRQIRQLSPQGRIPRHYLWPALSSCSRVDRFSKGVSSFPGFLHKPFRGTSARQRDSRCVPVQDE